MGNAIDNLRQDHETISTALQILDVMVSKGAEASREDCKALVDYLKEYADTYHHGKEENFLFPALTEAGLPVQGGPVGVMLSEHEQGREFIQSMEQAIAGTPDYSGFAQAAKLYTDLLRNHIHKAART